jgi:hypothetical protein
VSDSRAVFSKQGKDETTMSTDDKKARANALFKEEKKQQGRQAVTEYHAQQEAVREKTERLRAQRLTRDAAEATKPIAADIEATPPMKAKPMNGDLPPVRLHRVKGRRVSKRR